MSDERHNNEPAVDNGTPATAPADAAGSGQPAGQAAESATGGFAAGRPEPPRKVPVEAAAQRGSGPAWLALLLALIAVAGAGWLYWQGGQRLDALDARLQTVDAATRESLASASRGGELAPEARQAIDALQQSVAGELRQLDQRLDLQVGELQPRLRQQEEYLQSLEQQLREQREVLGAMTGSDREAWLLAEVEYLLRLANQRLLMTADAVSARKLLASADAILRQLDDSGLHALRRAVAADRAALRAVPQIDVEGLYLRLAAVIDQIAGLEVFVLPERGEQPAQTAEPGWRERLRQGYAQALAKLSDYIAIRRRDVHVEALMDPQLEDLMRQNTAMLLQQAQIALLSGNQRLYRESLQRTRHWVAEFFLLDQSVAESVLREIDDLADEVVAVPLPDVTASLQALEAALDQRLLRRQEEQD